MLPRSIERGLIMKIAYSILSTLILSLGLNSANADELLPLTLGKQKVDGGEFTFFEHPSSDGSGKKYLRYDASSIVAQPPKALQLLTYYYDANKDYIGESSASCVESGPLGQSTQTGGERGSDLNTSNVKYFRAKLYDCRWEKKILNGAQDLETLRSALHAESPSAKSQAALVIGKLGEAGRPLIPDLLSVIDPKQPDFFFNRYAVGGAMFCLGKLQEPRVVPIAQAYLKDKDSWKYVVTGICNSFGPMGKDLVADIRAIAQRKREPVAAGLEKCIASFK